MLSDICFDMIDLIDQHTSVNKSITDNEFISFNDWLEHYLGDPFNYPVDVISSLKRINEQAKSSKQYSQLKQACRAVVEFYGPMPENLPDNAYSVFLQKLNSL